MNALRQHGRTGVLLLVVAGLGPACGMCLPVSQLALCDDDNPCPAGFRCDPVLALCVAVDEPGADASVLDHARFDAGGQDRARTDVLLRDAVATIDSGRPDVGPVGVDAARSCATTLDLGSQNLTCGTAAHASAVWDLTLGDLTLSFVYDARGAIDRPSGARTFGQCGVRQVGAADRTPAAGSGVWVATDVEWRVGTLDPDPVDGGPTLDIDDKLIVQKASGEEAEAYNLPRPTGGNPGENHNFWFDRDGVDQWQDDSLLMVSGSNYNTGGIYQVQLALHATDATHGTANLTINGLVQGFETDGDWGTMELAPAGMTWSGDVTQLQVFFGLACQVVASTIALNDIAVTGCLRQ